MRGRVWTRQGAGTAPSDPLALALQARWSERDAGSHLGRRQEFALCECACESGWHWRMGEKNGTQVCQDIGAVTQWSRSQDVTGLCVDYNARPVTSFYQDVTHRN